MSRAVFAVVMCGSIAAAGDVAQRPAMSRTTAARWATSAGARAYGGTLVVWCSGGSWQLTGVL